MKQKTMITILVLLFTGFHSEAQLMEKLKKRAEEKKIETNQEVKYDSTAYDPNLDTYEEEPEDLVINNPEEFFTTDVVMALYNEHGELVQTSYFDAETIAMRTESNANPKPIYHDRAGKIYAFNDENGYYETMALLPASSMGFMTAGMTSQAYKLPPTPYFQAFEALSRIDIALNFLVLEMAFVYQPKHFEKDAFYQASQVSCGGTSCTRFSYNDAEYNGSYIQFDARGRLRELNIISSKPESDDNQSGKFVFSYKPCNVTLPDAEELSLIPGPLGEVFSLEKGLEPWKHNKKDKKKDNKKDNKKQKDN